MVEGRSGLPFGTLLDGSYRIERVIGSGGFGITYQAEDVKLGTDVAIKEYFPSDFGTRPEGLDVHPISEKQRQTFEWGRSRFLQEARTLARFRHPSIVQVTRVFEANSTAYMVMSFERGQSFQAWLEALGRPPAQDELDRIAEPLLEALEAMHSLDFLHRDIAPDNIIVREDGSPVLLDFGAARRAAGEIGRPLTGIVKAGYSPQEQYATDGRLQGPWSDLYAFGGTLYRAVTGKPPDEATLRGMEDHMPSARSAALGTYRENFLAAVDACLKVKIAERPQSVAELRKLLTSGAQGRKSTARARSFGQQRRWRWRVSATVMLTAIAVAVSAFALAELTARFGGRQMEQPNGPTVRIPRQSDGRFRTMSEINGIATRMLIDTGASTVVLKPADARRAGIDVDGLRYSVPVQTLTGTTYAAHVRLRSLAVGPVSVEELDALVAKPGTLEENLLGLSYLNRLRSYDFTVDGLVLVGRR